MSFIAVVLFLEYSSNWTTLTWLLGNTFSHVTRNTWYRPRWTRACNKVMNTLKLAKQSSNQLLHR